MSVLLYTAEVQTGFITDVALATGWTAVGAATGTPTFRRVTYAPDTPQRINGAYGDYMHGMKISGVYGWIDDFGYPQRRYYPIMWRTASSGGKDTYTVRVDSENGGWDSYHLTYDTGAGRWKMFQDGRVVSPIAPEWWAAVGDEYDPQLADWTDSADPSRNSYGIPIIEQYQLTGDPVESAQTDGLPAAPAAPDAVQA